MNVEAIIEENRLLREQLARIQTGVQVSYQPGLTGEADVQQLLRLKAPTLNAVLWRNNNGALQNEAGAYIRFGLGNDSKRVNDKFKSSDLIGMAPDGRFLAVEVKEPGWKYRGTKREEAQQNFGEYVRSRGGLFGFATSPEDLENILNA